MTSPRRSTAAMAGIGVVALAATAFGTGLIAERDRPMQVFGAPLQATAAVALAPQQVYAMLYTPPPETPPETAEAPRLASAAAPVPADSVVFVASRAAPAVAYNVLSSAVSADASDIAPAAEAVSPQPPPADPIGGLLDTPY